MGVEKGTKAPAFELPYEPGKTVNLAEMLGKEKVVLLFMPLAFSGVCTKEMCTMRDDWKKWEALGAKVFGVCPDSPFVTAKFRESENIPYPILSDFNRDVSKAWGGVHPDLKGMRDVPKRSAFVIDSTGTVAYAWVSETPANEPPYEELAAAVKSAK